MDIKTIRTAVQDEFKINIKRESRKTNYVAARTIYFKLCKELTHQGYAEIGRSLNKNHATVMHGIKNIFECWIFCKNEKHINIYNAIYHRLQGDRPILAPNTENIRELQEEIARLRRKLLLITPKKRYEKALQRYNMTTNFSSKGV